jgi:hypothetical protein
MELKIASEALGEIGAKYDAEAAAAEGINVQALIEGGFLEEQNPTPKVKKTEK